MNFHSVLQIVFILVLLILLFRIVIPSFRYTWRKRASRNWPITGAVIEEAHIKRGTKTTHAFGLMCTVYLTYWYNLYGVRHTGEFALMSDKSEAEQLTRSLVGGKVTIQYDTNHPEISLVSEVRLLGKKVLQDPAMV
jgi:hypothetical protein